ncbi:MAG: beta-N-acetylhexosaminidase [Alphaproteobacteria bacterium]|nr:beta-N-acetylhexosaminidase [Alphaproteobacteria bacterium]
MPSLKSRPLAVVFGCAGTALSDDERAFFRETDPLGFILFQRNCETPDQVRALVNDLRETVGRADAPVLIDQEGGRVARLKPPHWPEFPSARAYAKLYAKNAFEGIDAAETGGWLIAHELAQLGVTVDCAPVLDLVQKGADPIIGDRAFGPDVETISILAKAFMDGLMTGGVSPVIKHIPGHGRATVDSHKALPVVDTDLATLQDTDFAPFRALHMAGWGMTAHVVYTAVDKKRPATMSETVIRDVIRGQLGFQGVLLSDDLSMKALKGGFADRARDCLAAGCDVALHCNGDRAEMQAVRDGAAEMSSKAWARFKMTDLHRAGAAREHDVAEARRRFELLMG